MAARSMVRMPPASVGPAAASGAAVLRRSGSCTLMGNVYGERRRGRPRQAGEDERGWAPRPYQRRPASSPSMHVDRLLLDPLRHLIVLREIIEASDSRVELDTDGTGRPMALLADDDLGLAVHIGHFHLPSRVVVGAWPRFLVAQIIFLAENEHHHVGVLLDRARFAQIRELRPFIITVLDLPR